MRRFSRLSITAVFLTLLLAAAVPAMAGKKSEPVSGSIDLVASAARLADGGDLGGPAYGDTVRFATEVGGKVSSHARIYVSLICRQGGTVVYQWSADPDFSFPLEDQVGQGLDWDGGPAECTGSLIYRVDKGRNLSITELDAVVFDVE